MTGTRRAVVLHEAAATLGFTEPVAVRFVSMLRFLADDQGPGVPGLCAARSVGERRILVRVRSPGEKGGGPGHGVHSPCPGAVRI